MSIYEACLISLVFNALSRCSANDEVKQGVTVEVINKRIINNKVKAL